MSLVLTRKSVQPSPEGQDESYSWPLVVDAVSSTPGLPSEIFVYHAALGDDPTGGGDVFECVATLPQIGEIGLAPRRRADGTVVPYYRMARLMFACRTPAEAEDLWGQVVEDARDLHADVLAHASLNDIEEVTIT